MSDTLSTRRLKTILFAIAIIAQLAACSSEETIGSTVTLNGTEAGAGSISIMSLSWVAPSQREDNTPIALSEIAGYRIYYGTAQGDYQNEIEINDAYNDAVDISLAPGSYYAVIKPLTWVVVKACFPKRLSWSFRVAESD